jgi:2-polyprenyl-6-methoxyphenol hydroxylase-like FAD-dependent oxidoreductase
VDLVRCFRPPIFMMTCQELQTKGKVAIVGGGPAGATLARLLQMRGVSVNVFERDASPTSRPQGGSLDLRRDAGQRAVDAAGLTEAFQGASRSEAKIFKMLDPEGRPHPAGEGGTHDDAGPEIDRGDLRQLLLDSLTPGTVAWGHGVKEMLPNGDGRWRLEFGNSAPFIADLVVGADGAGSRIRPLLTSIQPRALGMTMVAAILRKELWRGSELADTLGEGSVMFAGHHQNIFVQRCNRDLILLYYSMTVSAEWPKSEGFALDNTEAVLRSVREAYRQWPFHLVEKVTQVDGNFHCWPLSVLPPDYSWQTKPGLTMIGDSSHVMPPFTGKGVNLAMLDALELADSLTAEPGAELTNTIAAFEKKMQGRTRQETGQCLQVGQNIYGLHVDFDRPSAGGDAASELAALSGGPGGD